MNVTYREATRQDEEQLFALAASLATSFKLEREAFEAIFQETLHNTNADLVVAEIGTTIIGYVVAFHHATFYANGVVTWVEELFVADEYRRMKIGKKLMEWIEHKAAERGSKLVALATRRASEFYKSIGYDESASYFKKSLK